MLFIEGFDGLASSDLAIKGWAYYAMTVDASYARLNGKGCRTLVNSSYMSKAFTATDTVIVGFAFKVDSQNPGSVLHLRNDTTKHVTLTYSEASQKLIVTNAADTELGSTANGSIVPSTWYYCELKVYVHDSAGTVDLRLNGVSAIAATGKDTRNGTPTTIDNVIFGAANSSASASMYFDDIYVFNTSGSTNNAFIGNVTIQTITPTSDSTVAWSRSGGSANYEMVDDSTQDGDTTYNYSATAAQQDLYGFSDLAANTATVYGVQVNVVAKKTDSSARSIKLLTKSATTLDSSTSMALDVSYTFYKNILEQDPDAVAAWTKSTVDAALFGVECV